MNFSWENAGGTSGNLFAMHVYPYSKKDLKGYISKSIMWLALPERNKVAEWLPFSAV